MLSDIEWGIYLKADARKKDLDEKILQCGVEYSGIRESAIISYTTRGEEYEAAGRMGCELVLTYNVILQY